MRLIFIFLTYVSIALNVSSQKNIVKSDSNTILHLIKADCPVPYIIPAMSNVKAAINRVKNYLEKSTHF